MFDPSAVCHRIQQSEHGLLVNLEKFAHLWVQAIVALAGLRASATCAVQVGGGAAEIADGAGKILLPGKPFRLLNHGISTPADDLWPLVPGDGAEGAVTATAADNGDRIPDHPAGRNIAAGWMGFAGKGQAFVPISVR